MTSRPAHLGPQRAPELQLGDPISVGGVVELLDEYRCGFAFAPGDAGALGALFEELLRDPGPLMRIRRDIAYPPGADEEAWLLASIYSVLAKSPLRVRSPLSPV